MEKTKLEQDIQQKLADRSIQPSASAWERLSLQLDEQQASKKRNKTTWLLYASIAASLALLFTLLNKEQPIDAMEEFVGPKQELVITPIDTTQFVMDPIEQIKESTLEEVIVETKKNIVKQPKQKTYKKEKKIPNKEIKQATDIVAVIDKKTEQEQIKKPVPIIETSKKTNSRIFVDSDALLYSVTHSKEDIRAYYKKYQISRAKVLESIKNELKNQHISVDAKIILAEVEMDLNEESFQNNFYQLIKKRVSDVATAIANRNN